MTRTEIEKRIAEINEEINYEKYKDRGYDFSKVWRLRAEKAELEKMLK